MTANEYKHAADILVNTSFVMCDSADIMVRRAELINLEYGITLEEEFKKTHKELLYHLQNARVTIEKFNRICDNELSSMKRDLMRGENNDLARLVLFYADRTCEDMTGKHKFIEDYIRYMPSTGHLKDSFIDKYFTLR